MVDNTRNTFGVAPDKGTILYPRYLNLSWYTEFKRDFEQTYHRFGTTD